MQCKKTKYLLLTDIFNFLVGFFLEHLDGWEPFDVHPFDLILG